MRDPKFIIKYWNENPLSKHLNYTESKQTQGKNPCMACGSYGSDRAHILALCLDGSNNESNVHMLCRECHTESEELDGYVYWLWLVCKATVFDGGTDMTYELDYTSEKDETLMKWAVTAEYLDKIKMYRREYEILSLLKGWEISQKVATEILANPSLLGFKFEAVDVDYLATILEFDKSQKWIDTHESD